VTRKAVLGIDIGGTKVKLAPVFGECELGKECGFPVPKGAGPEKLAAAISQHAILLGARSDVSFTAAGAGCPGHVADDRRILIYAPNLGWKNAAFADMLEKELSIPVLLENDVNAAALGEQLYGSGRGARNVICIFAGTGVGGGIVVNGEVLRGAAGNAAEVGHTLFRPGGRKCNCGREGCVEAYAGGAHIPKYYEELGGKPDLSATEIWEIARKGGKAAIQVRTDALQALVTLLVNLQTLFDADRIVLGGGVIEHVPGLYRDVKEALGDYLTGPWESKVKVVRSTLGSNAAVLGAAALARRLL
jgi:glucokinase